MDIIIIYDIFNIKKKCTLQQIIIYYYFLSPSKYTAECEEGSTEAFFLFYHQLYGRNRLLFSNHMA